MTYQELDQLYFKTKRLRRKYARNTYLIKTPDSIQVVYHNTVIVEITKDNKYRLNTGGWYSKTTKQRMNWFTPFYIGTTKNRWWIETTLVGPGGESKTKTRFENQEEYSSLGVPLGFTRIEPFTPPEPPKRPKPASNYKPWTPKVHDGGIDWQGLRRSI